MAAQYRQLPPDVMKKRQGIIKEAEGIKARMAAAAPEDRHLHESALAMLGQKHERLLAPYKISGPAAQQGVQGGVTPHGPKHVTKLDTAAEDAEAIEKSHRAASGKGVQKLDEEAIAQADKDKAWASMSPEEQQAAAKTAKPSAPSGAAHTTETPGSVHKTAMAGALEKAGVSSGTLKPSSVEQKTGQPTYTSTDKALKVTPAVSARNNMATPRGQVDVSAVAGRTVSDSPEELARARAAATRGTRGGNKAAEEAAARASSRRSAASAAPGKMGPQFTRVGGTGAEESSAPGRDWITPSQISAKAPATPSLSKAPGQYADSGASATPTVFNPAPIAPTPQPSGPLQNVIGSKPGKGISPGHMVSSAPGRDWLTPQAANRAKAKAAPREVVSEQPALATPAAEKPAAPAVAPKAAGPREVAQESALGPTAQAKMERASAAAGPAPSARPAVLGGGPSKSPVPLAPAHVAPKISGQRTPVSAQQMEMAGGGAEPPKPPIGHAPMVGPAGPGRSGRTGAAPRGEIGGGRGGNVVTGGESSVNIGGANYGTVTSTHHVYNINYGQAGHIGNVGTGGPGARPGGGSAGREPGEGREPKAGAGVKGDIWYKDVSGKHGLRAGVEHVTGQTGGHGEKLPKPAQVKGGGSILGGQQKPISGSPRAAGAQTTAAPSTTGTTLNWQGPQGGVKMPGSGIGSAGHSPTTQPLPKTP